MISAIASSTTERVFENGALNTATPRFAAAARSTWLVPMQNAPTASRSGGGGEHALGDLGLGPDAEQAEALELLDQLVLAERAGQRLYLVTGFRQSSRRVRVNVLQQQGTVERVQRQHLFPQRNLTDDPT